MGTEIKALDIASLFIQLANSLPNDQIDNLKLNNLCYYAQGWHLARFGEPLFKEDIQAWDYGPLIPEVYYTYRVCGNEPIQEPATDFDESVLPRKVLSLLSEVYINYGKYTSAALIDLTHMAGTPWRQVYEPKMNNVINNELIKSYFLNSDEMKGIEYNFSPEFVVAGIEKTPATKRIGIAKGKYKVPEDFDGGNEEITAELMGDVYS